MDARAEAAQRGIYVASKTSHAEMWREYRRLGWPIVSTWIDEAGVGETSDFADLWLRCVSEASSARALVVFMHPDEVLKGGWVEVGAALASGVPVHAVGINHFSVSNHPAVTHHASLGLAMQAVWEIAAAEVNYLRPE